MNATSLSPRTTTVANAARPDTTTPSRGLAALSLATGLLAFAPVAILGAAIGWPASLDRPAAEQLAAIAAAPGSVSAGYGLYLLYSLLIAPLMIGLAARLPGGLARPLAFGIAAFASLSALARAIGILRWQTVMPELAARHAGADAATRVQIEQLFDALTTYGGGIGEVLGVSLTMAMALAPLCLVALRSAADGAPVMPRWLAGVGLLAAVLLAGLSLPTLGVPLEVPVAAAVSLLSLWMLALGVWLWRQPAPRDSTAKSTA